MKNQTALLLLFVSLILTCEIYSNCHDCTVNSCSKNSNTSKFKAWCSFENKCSKNETNCKNFELFYFSDNYTHSSISKKKIIELLEPERNPKYDKENYWKNYIFLFLVKIKNLSPMFQNVLFLKVIFQN
jgi:hypothetical protein